MPAEQVLLDPSRMLRAEPSFAGKDVARFRDYSVDESDPVKERVRRTYYEMHRRQTYAFAAEKRAEWLRLDHFRATIRQALEQLNCLVDESDPDTDVPNLVHAFQTAERIRSEHPRRDWFHLTGLVHDLGKVLALHGEPQWAVVGDTFVVGCDWPDAIVYGRDSFRGNPDAQDARYKCGVYSPGCGLDAVLVSWGHDEYLYQVLRRNGARLPDEALYMIRYHSLYPWHSGGAYRHLHNAKDEEMLPWVLEFNKYDLYTKSDDTPDVEALWPYYQSLIDKYIPGVLNW